jgi:hypothetical protein
MEMNARTSMSIADLLNRAKVSIEAGEDHLHQAAEDIAAASIQGATQREIAEWSASPPRGSIGY